MQTFLPWADFESAAIVLDNKRLGKQRVECLQIIKALADPEYGWQSHPAVQMWRGYEAALVAYADAIISEWIRRGFYDTCRLKIAEVALPNKWMRVCPDLPLWIGDEEFHRSHRSNLLRKDAAHYGPLFDDPDLPDDLPYVWPTKRKASRTEVA
jgi:hypothetical protein